MHLSVARPPAVTVPPLGRGASMAIAAATERVAGEIRTRLDELRAQLAAINREAERLIDEFERRSRVLEANIERFTIAAADAQAAIRELVRSNGSEPNGEDRR
jgi:phage-related minor tail protein